MCRFVEAKPIRLIVIPIVDVKKLGHSSTLSVERAWSVIVTCRAPGSAGGGFDPGSFTSPNYYDLQSRAYRDGMRISTNS